MLNLLQDRFCFFFFSLGGFMWPSGEIPSIVTVFPIDPVLSITDAVVLLCCRYMFFIYIYRAFDYMSFIYCTLYILYVLIYNIADVSTSTVSVVHPSDPSRWAVEVKVGFRCQAPRCAHCEGTCNCDWKQPLKELIDPWRCIPKQSQRKNNSVISLEIDTW